ncbi:TPA: hypothetical protein H1V70_000107 [Salmonella enterica]|nr:hypothetical protein [Salmonella enterica]
MAKPLRFTRERVVEIAKRYFVATHGEGQEILKEAGIDKSNFHKYLKRYDVKVKLTAEVC